MDARPPEPALSPSPTRRDFLRGTAAAGAIGFPAIVPRHVLGGPGHVPPSETVHVAIVGAGGKGKENTKALLEHADVRVVAVADPAERWDLAKFYYRTEGGRGPVAAMVETDNAAKSRGGKVGVYRDFRELLERESAVDAVVCSTPDHLHAFVSVLAMRAGKHVYCEKPLAHNIAEARLMARVAQETGLATQMGNAGHSTEGIRRTVEFLRAGAIGAVREIHAWVPTSRWNPGLEGLPSGTPPPPDGLDWDLWIGPREPRPFHPAYAPVAWRDFWEFGCGALGDFGCHDLDGATWAFDLPAPTSAEVIPCGFSNRDIAPYGEIGYYRFPARDGRPAPELTWYSGGLRPPRPDALPEGMDLPARGVLFVGESGVIQCEGAGGAPRLYPEARRSDFEPPAPTLARSNGHYRDWLDAVNGGSPASAEFGYAAQLT
jgi:predicted dehydrogenase